MDRRPSIVRRLTTALLGALLVVPVVAAQTSTTTAGGLPTCAGRSVDDLVTVVTPPSFPTPPAALVEGRRGQLVDVAVEPERGLRVWATDGWSIARSDDAGCTWTVVWDLSQSGDPGGVGAATSAIMSLVVPRAGGNGRVYGLVQDLSVPNTSARFRVVVSEDGGTRFEVRGEGLPAVALNADAPACGDARSCGIAATGLPGSIYLRFASEGGTVIHASDDGGRTFQTRTAAGAFVDTSGQDTRTRGPIIEDLVVDPAEPNLLWGTSAVDGPSFSSDGARTFSIVDPFAAFILPLREIDHLDLVNAEFGRGILAVGKDASGRVRAATSWDDGSVFESVDRLGALPGAVTGAVLTDQGISVVATGQGLYAAGRPETAPTGSPVVAGVEHGGLRHLQAVRRQGAGRPDVVWGHTDTEIVTVGLRPWGPPSIPRFEVPLELGAFNPFETAQTPLGSLTGRTSVDLLPGAKADEPYDLVLPPVPVPVDVFFLLDETRSMQDEFDALAGGIKRIVQDLGDAGVDVQVGLATYGNGYRYRLYRTIGPIDDDFLTRLASIRTGGDGEVAYTGLNELVTGTGLKRSAAGQGVAPGKDAGWREGTERMVVHVTDEGLAEEPEGPFKDDVIRNLRAAKVKHLGLIANDYTNGTANGVGPQVANVRYDWTPMFELADRTGAHAPAGGIDCNSDGITDVQEGDPIACYLPPASTNQALSVSDRVELIPDFAEVILAMLRELTIEGVVSVHTRVNGKVGTSSPLLAGLAFNGGGNSTRVNLTVPQQLGITARVRCTQEFSGRRDTVDFVGVTGTIVVAATSLTISCGNGPGDPAIAAVAAPRAAAVAAQAPAPPPAPIQAPATAQGAAQANAVSSANSTVPQAGAAAAQQEQQQHQVASIGKDGKQEQPGIAYEFTARRDHRDAPVGATAVGALAMTAGAAMLARRRQDAGRTRRIDVR